MTISQIIAKNAEKQLFNRIFWNFMSTNELNNVNNGILVFSSNKTTVNYLQRLVILLKQFNIKINKFSQYNMYCIYTKTKYN